MLTNLVASVVKYAGSVMASDPRDQALDAVGILLRRFARDAFDVDGIAARDATSLFERWSRHLTTGAAHPKTQPRSGEPRSGEEVRRDFAGMQTDFAKHRTAEREHVLRLREVVWQLLGGIRTALLADREPDERLGVELDSLRRAAETADLTQLRQRVARTIAVVEDSLATRRARHEGALRELGAHVRELKTELAEARHRAETDGLTELYNRASFDAHLTAAISLAVYTAEPLSLLMIDVDHFKKINDTYGHRTGDEALKAVAAAALKSAYCRTDFVARYGGEELAAVLSDTDGPGAERVAERVRAAVRAALVPGAPDLRMTVSIGVAVHRPEDTSTTLIERADGALYAAKHGGRDRVVIG
jgi:diguanylate cyclase